MEVSKDMIQKLRQKCSFRTNKDAAILASSETLC
jgi:hypothetical protein